MEALISNFRTLLTKKDHYVTHLPYMLMCLILHNTAETLWSVVSYANIYIPTELCQDMPDCRTFRLQVLALVKRLRPSLLQLSATSV